MESSVLAEYKQESNTYLIIGGVLTVIGMYSLIGFMCRRKYHRAQLAVSDSELEAAQVMFTATVFLLLFGVDTRGVLGIYPKWLASLFESLVVWSLGAQIMLTFDRTLRVIIETYEILKWYPKSRKVSAGIPIFCFLLVCVTGSVLQGTFNNKRYFSIVSIFSVVCFLMATGTLVKTALLVHETSKMTEQSKEISNPRNVERTKFVLRKLVLLSLVFLSLGILILMKSVQNYMEDNSTWSEDNPKSFHASGTFVPIAITVGVGQVFMIWVLHGQKKGIRGDGAAKNVGDNQGSTKPNTKKSEDGAGNSSLQMAPDGSAPAAI